MGVAGGVGFCLQGIYTLQIPECVPHTPWAPLWPPIDTRTASTLVPGAGTTSSDLSAEIETEAGGFPTPECSCPPHILRTMYG